MHLAERAETNDIHPNASNVLFETINRDFGTESRLERDDEMIEVAVQLRGSLVIAVSLHRPNVNASHVYATLNHRLNQPDKTSLVSRKPPKSCVK